MDFLSDTQRTQLQNVLDALGHQATRGVPKRSRPGPAPLSFAQQRFWLLHHMDPGSARCNAPAAIRLRGGLDVDALECAIRTIVERHETLRTCFPTVRGEPEARVCEVSPSLIRRRDLATLTPAEAEREAQAYVAAEAARPFDIAAEAGIRFSIVRVTAVEHWLVIVAHHIVFDTWSLAILSRELFGVYAALRSGSVMHLPDLPVQYSDVATWERDDRFAGVRDRQLAFWSKTLKGAPELLGLRHDRPRQRQSSHRPCSETFTLARDTAGAIAAVSRRDNVSPFAIALAGLSLLLHRYTASRDIVISSAVSNRKGRDTDGLIGCFLNTVLLRLAIEPGESFHDLLMRARGVTLDALDHADVPFEQVIAALNPSRSHAYTPYAQVMLVVQNTELEMPVVDGLDIARLPIGEHLAPQQDLVVHLRDSGGTVYGLAEYNGDLFDASTVRRMMADFDRLLSAGLHDARLPLTRVRPERAADAGPAALDRRAAPPRELVFCHTLIDRVAALTPHAVAVTDDTSYLTYGELRRRSDALADGLARRGVAAGAMVVVYLEPSASAAIALLALQKIGAIAVPAARSLALGRIRAIVGAVSAAAIVTDGPAVPMPETERGTLWIDVIAESASSRGDERSVGAQKHHDQGVCLVGDSRGGSLSSAVLWTYGSLAAALDAFAALGIVSRRDVVAAVSPLSTPAGVLDLLGALTAGARVVCQPSWRARVVADGAVDVDDATVIHLSALGWRAMLDAGLTGVRGVKALVAGDIVPDDLACALAARGMTVWSLFGSAEAGPCAMAAPVVAGAAATPRFAVDGATASVLDASFEPAPAGVAGELCVGAHALARGYLVDAALTAERFVPDPFGAKPGARMFRTGCTAVAADSGGIGVLHRLDPPAVLEGHRIDLGVVEATLRRHPAVGDAVVMARATSNGKRLTAYVMPRRDDGAGATGAALQGAELRDFARLQMPAFMVPQDVVLVPRWPLQRDGLLNRPELLLLVPEVSADAVPQLPSTPNEKLVATFFRELFNMKEIGVHADFFELGGDSLRLQRLLARIDERVHVHLPVHIAFANPTIGHLAAYLDRVQQLKMTDDEELAATVDGLTDDEVKQLLKHTLGGR